jgi:hypothetical protein
MKHGTILYYLNPFVCARSGVEIAEEIARSVPSPLRERARVRGNMRRLSCIFALIL